MTQEMTDHSLILQYTINSHYHNRRQYHLYLASSSSETVEHSGENQTTPLVLRRGDGQCLRVVQKMICQQLV